MRIFFITNNYTPYTSGVANAIIATTNALAKSEHEVFIVTLNFAPLATADPTYVIRVPCPITFMYKKNYMAIPWRPTHFIKHLLKQYKPDIVHVHHPFLLGVSGLKAARSYNIPCVFTYHTMYEDYAHYVPLPVCITKPLIRFMVKRFCNKVDGIIAPSTAIKEYLTAQNIAKPITVIPSPLRPLFFTTNATAKTLPNNKPFELLIVSRFTPEKNIPFVFDVFKQLPDSFSLMLVGYGSDYEKLQQLAFNTLQLSPERVHFIHKPDQETLLTLYRNANLFIFSSKTDTQGIVLTESMSQGVPVVALDGPGQRDIIIDGYNGFIIENAEHAVKTIINIAHDKGLYTKLSSGALATAQKYHANFITQQLLNFYQTMIH